MTMKIGDIRRVLLIGLMALTVNILLFAGLPNILPGQSVPSRIDNIQAVDFLRVGPEGEPAVKKIKTSEKTPPPEPLKTIPRNVMKTTTPPKQITIKMPDFNADVAPDMHPGVALAAPAQPSTAAPAAVSAAFAPKESYGLREVDQAPVAIMKTRPQYPYRARRLSLEGEVDVKFLVDRDGRVSRITILSARPPKLFEQSVLRALSRWQFSPGTVKGNAVNTWVTTTIAFRLDEL